MKIKLVSFSDTGGGAARAAYRTHKALIANNINSSMMVDEFRSGDWTVTKPWGKFGGYLRKLRPLVAAIFTKLLKTKNPVLHSPAVLPSSLHKKLNESDADVINLHWINSEMMSIQDISKIKKPLVWTLHDMWAFCGAEHYSDDFRWRDGYKSNNRPAHEKGFDLNRFVWRMKKKWKNPIHIVVPSQWLSDCVRQSFLMRDWPVSVIPNPIDIDIWKPINSKDARSILGLPLDVPLLLFGAIGGGDDPRKGYDLLIAALQIIKNEIPRLELVVFGQSAPRYVDGFGFKIHYVGHLYDDISLRVLYSAADVMVVPSRMEAFGQTASEAQSCGTPVVAFKVTGLLDVVEHEVTGYLANPFDVNSLATGIKWVLQDIQRLSCLSKSSRERAVRLWSYEKVASSYKELFIKLIKN